MIAQDELAEFNKLEQAWLDEQMKEEQLDEAVKIVQADQPGFEIPNAWWSPTPEQKRKAMFEQQGPQNRHERRRREKKLKVKVRQIIKKQDKRNAKYRAAVKASSVHHDGAAGLGEVDLGEVATRVLGG